MCHSGPLGPSPFPETVQGGAGGGVAAAVSFLGLCSGRVWKVPWVHQGPVSGQKTPMCPQRSHCEQLLPRFLRTESQDRNTRYTGSCSPYHHLPGPGQQKERLVSEIRDAGRPQAPGAGTQAPQWEALAHEGEEAEGEELSFVHVGKL